MALPIGATVHTDLRLNAEILDDPPKSPLKKENFEFGSLLVKGVRENQT